MTKCPTCGGPGGVPMFTSIAPCEACHRDVFKPTGAFRDLVKPVASPRVRYIPQWHRKAVEISLLATPLISTRWLNQGKITRDLLHWVAPSAHASSLISDLGEDPANWVAVPPGQDWGQTP